MPFLKQLGGNTLRFTIFHSPDPDDAFMFAPLQLGLIKTPFEIDHKILDIQTLNELTLKGKTDVSAISFHAYPYVKDKYFLFTTGASVGEGYGPTIVSTKRDLMDIKYIAVPGNLTTAYLVLQIFMKKVDWYPKVEFMKFDEILSAVSKGDIEAGLLIHEGQINYKKYNVNLIVDLGAWWKDRKGTILPLGGLVLSRKLADYKEEIKNILKQSFKYALSHPEPCLEFAKKYARDLTDEENKKFVSMYVNKWTIDLGEEGIKAVEDLLKEGKSLGIIKTDIKIDWV